MTIPVMIFAAGFGTRMRHLTAERPKPLVHVAGRRLIDHALAQCGPQPRRTVVNIHYRGAQIAAYLADDPGIAISDETDRILETGGGLRHALPLLGPGSVATLNADMVWDGPAALPLLESHWRPDEMDALMLLIPAERAHGHAGQGSFAMDGAGRLSRGGPWIYTGAQILRTDRLSEIPDDVFSLNRLWDLMLAGDRVHGLEYPGHWADVGSPEGVLEAEKMVTRHEA